MKLILSIALLAFSIAAAAAIPLSDPEFGNAVDADLELEDALDSPVAADLDLEDTSSEYSEDLDLDADNTDACAPGMGYSVTIVKNQKVPRCLACAAGQFSLGGTATCERCPPGTTSLAQIRSASCTKCPAGTFSGSSGSPRCTPCPQGSYGDGEGYSSCKLCPSGKTTRSTGARQSSDCSLASTVCPKDSVWTGSACAKTRDGSADCPVNTYYETKARACQSCPAGTVYSGTDAMSVNACKPCPAGSATFLGKAGYGCSLCPAGQYSQFAGQRECTVCPARSYSATAGQTSCTFNSCPSGTFGARGGLAGATKPAPCQKCPAQRPFGDGSACCTEEEGKRHWPNCPETHEWLFGKKSSG